MINYGAPVSGYVDYNFEKVGNVRRERYMDNFYASEAVRQSAADLQAAPFEGDQAYRQQLLQGTDKMLAGIAEKGDYENLTVDVARASTGYQKRAKPLAQNLAYYNEYKKGLDKLYEDGKIDNEDYKGTMALAQKGYSGLQVDENGEASKYFSGREAIQNPDIPKMLRETLNGMVADSGEQVIEVMGQGPDGMYQVKTTKGNKFVSADRVEQAMRMVMEDKRVTSYIDRKAEIRTGLMDEKGLGVLMSQNMLAVDQTLGNLDAAISESSGQRKEALEGQRAELIQSKGELEEVIASGDIEKIELAARQIERNKINAMYDASAKAKYTYSQDSYKQELSPDRYAQQRQQQAFESVQGLPSFTIESGGIQFESQFGTSSMQVSSNLQEVHKELQAMREDYNQNADSWDESLKESFANDMFKLGRQIAAHRTVLEHRYRVTNPDLLDNETYRRLQERARKAELAYTNRAPGSIKDGTSFSVELLNELQEAEADCETWMRQNSTADPAGGRRQVDITMSTVGNVPGMQPEVAKNLQQGLDGLLGTPRQDMVVFRPGTTEQTTISELMGSDDAYEGLSTASLVGNVTLSTSVEIPGVGRIAQATYKTDKGTVTVNYPLNGQIGIPDLENYLRAPYMQFMSEVQNLGLEIGKGTHAFPVRSQSQGVSGELVVDYETGRAYTIFGDIKSPEYQLNSPTFKEEFEKDQLTLQ